MTFDQVWQHLVKKKPSLAKDDSTVEFKAANLRQLLRQVYEQGQTSVEKKSNMFDEFFNKPRTPF